jgi:hypothetical protein
MVLSIGLQATIKDATYLLRNKSLLIRSLVAMDIVMPLFALAVVMFTTIPVSAKIALAALSVAPVPPLLPRRTAKVTATGDYAISLLVVAALLAIAYVPRCLRRHRTHQGCRNQRSSCKGRIHHPFDYPGPIDGRHFRERSMARASSQRRAPAIDWRVGSDDFGLAALFCGGVAEGD